MPPWKSARGLAHSKPWRRFVAALCLLLYALFIHPSLLHAQPAATNHVLDLDGKDSYVELPPNIFNGLDEATVEAWVKWRSFPPAEWARFFSYGVAFNDTGFQGEGNGTLNFFVTDDPRPVKGVGVAGLVRTNEWHHLAAVTGKDGMSLYFNGALMATNGHTGSFSALRNGTRFRLGRSVVDAEPFVDGQLDEVRVWKVARTAEQIRQGMFEPLAGTEEGLAGLWNFEDPANPASDATPAGNHGQLRGQARLVEAALPAVLPVWSRLLIKFGDATRTMVSGVTVRALTNGVEVARSALSGNDGVGVLTVFGTVTQVDLEATGPNDLGGWHVQIPLTPGVERTLEWKLTPAVHLAGRLHALDGKTALPGVVVELVQAEGLVSSTPNSELRTSVRAS